MGKDLIPFGKYKGQPTTAMAADADYCEWLMAQPWFRLKYANVYNILVSGGSEPQDSPEHNEMQARFLDNEWCARLASVLIPEWAGKCGAGSAQRALAESEMYKEFGSILRADLSPASPVSRSFESDGWDVAMRMVPAYARLRLTGDLPPCICTCDHDRDCPSGSRCRGGERDGCVHAMHTLHGFRAHDPRSHCTAGCRWEAGTPLQTITSGPDKEFGHTRAEWLVGVKLKPEDLVYREIGGSRILLVELKPDLGDDYPTVLRTVQNRKAGIRIGPDGKDTYKCVVARRHGFEGVNWKQVQRIFAAQHIDLIAESDVQAAFIAA